MPFLVLFCLIIESFLLNYVFKLLSIFCLILMLIFCFIFYESLKVSVVFCDDFLGVYWVFKQLKSNAFYFFSCDLTYFFEFCSSLCVFMRFVLAYFFEALSTAIAVQIEIYSQFYRNIYKSSFFN